MGSHKRHNESTVYRRVISLYLSFVLYMGLVMDWFNPKRVAKAYENEYKLCFDWWFILSLSLFLQLSQVTECRINTSYLGSSGIESHFPHCTGIISPSSSCQKCTKRKAVNRWWCLLPYLLQIIPYHHPVIHQYIPCSCWCNWWHTFFKED